MKTISKLKKLTFAVAVMACSGLSFANSSSNVDATVELIPDVTLTTVQDIDFAKLIFNGIANGYVDMNSDGGYITSGSIVVVGSPQAAIVNVTGYTGLNIVVQASNIVNVPGLTLGDLDCKMGASSFNCESPTTISGVTEASSPLQIGARLTKSFVRVDPGFYTLSFDLNVVYE